MSDNNSVVGGGAAAADGGGAAGMVTWSWREEDLMNPKQFTNAKLKAMLVRMAKRKNKIDFRVSCTKKKLVKQILALQQCPDVDAATTDVVAASVAICDEDLDKRVDEVMHQSTAPKTVANKLRDYRDLVKFCKRYEGLVSPGDPNNDDPFLRMEHINFTELSAKLLCRYLSSRIVKRRSGPQKKQYDEAKEGEKPVYHLSHSGQARIVTSVRYVARIFGQTFPSSWENAVKKYLKGCNNMQARQIKAGTRFKHGKRHRKRHLRSDLFKAMVEEMCHGIIPSTRDDDVIDYDDDSIDDGEEHDHDNDADHDHDDDDGCLLYTSPSPRDRG